MAGGGDLLERFGALCRDREPDLFEAALLVAALVDPSDDGDAARRDVASLAARVREKADAGLARAAALHEVLFSEEGFRGDEESYDEPSNSSVASVLARRRGMPITLSIVAVEVGRLAGLRLTGVGLPGHFVVGGPDLPEGTYLDPFDAGALYEVGGLSRRLGAIFGSPIQLGPDALRPETTRSILARVLLNLRRSWERRDRWEQALEALDFAEALDPENGAYRRERGLLLLKTGRTEEALEILERYAESAGGEEAEAVLRLIRIVRGQGEAERVELPGQPRRIFTLEEARELLPRVRELTAEAVSRYGQLAQNSDDERESVVREWMRELHSLGLEIKGLWLVDFDSGAGYYCWKYPEPALDHFHGYEEGFAGRLSLQ
jgi:regulator of sirC expression with transglutaminase-like and TPR domain